MVELGLERQLKEKKKILHKHFFPPTVLLTLQLRG